MEAITETIEIANHLTYNDFLSFQFDETIVNPKTTEEFFKSIKKIWAEFKFSYISDASQGRFDVDFFNMIENAVKMIMMLEEGQSRIINELICVSFLAGNSKDVRLHVLNVFELFHFLEEKKIFIVNPKVSNESLN